MFWIERGTSGAYSAQTADVRWMKNVSQEMENFIAGQTSSGKQISLYLSLTLSLYVEQLKY